MTSALPLGLTIPCLVAGTAPIECYVSAMYPQMTFFGLAILDSKCNWLFHLHHWTNHFAFWCCSHTSKVPQRKNLYPNLKFNWTNCIIQKKSCFSSYFISLCRTPIIQTHQWTSPNENNEDEIELGRVDQKKLAGSRSIPRIIDPHDLGARL